MRPQPFPSRVAAAWTGELVSKICAFLAFMRIARTLTPTAYGQVEWALSVTVVFALVTDAGLSVWSSARIGARPDEAASLVTRVGWLRLALAIPAYAAAAVVAWLRGGGAGAALLVCGLTLLLSPLSLHYVFDGLFGTRWSAVGNAVRGATFLAAVLVLVGPSSTPSVVAAADVTAAIVLCVYQITVLHRIVRLRLRPIADAHNLGALFGQSWRVGAGLVAWQVHMYGGLIILGWLATSDDVAWFSAALRIMIAMQAGVWLYHSALLPTLARLAARPDDWNRVLDQSLRLSAWVSAAVAIVGTLAAKPLVTLAFGPTFSAAAPDLALLIWVVPIAWVGEHTHYALIAAGRTALESRARLAGALISVVLMIAFVPAWHSMGAAIALVTGSVVSVAVAWMFAERALPSFGHGRSLTASVVGGAVSLGTGLIVRPFAGPIFSAACAGALVVLGAATVEGRHTRGLIAALVNARPSAARVPRVRVEQ